MPPPPQLPSACCCYPSHPTVAASSPHTPLPASSSRSGKTSPLSDPPLAPHRCLRRHLSEESHGGRILDALGLGEAILAAARKDEVRSVRQSQQWTRTLLPNGHVFFTVKAFAAGVILATGMLNIPPAAFDALAPPCGGGDKASGFPYAGLVAMCSAMATMMVDSAAAGYYQPSHFRKARPVDAGADGGRHRSDQSLFTYSDK